MLNYFDKEKRLAIKSIKKITDTLDLLQKLTEAMETLYLKEASFSIKSKNQEASVKLLIKATSSISATVASLERTREKIIKTRLVIEEKISKSKGPAL